MRDELRRPFRPEQIGKLPKPYKKDAPKGKCRDCGGYHGLPAVHLDFVGHAAVTDRLNKVEPGWSYEITPVEYQGKDGRPHVAGVRGVMRLGDVARPEAGDVDAETSYGDELKKAISDFIRRGAMRFGVALDLWSKEDLLESGTHVESLAGEGDLSLPRETAPAKSSGVSASTSPTEPPSFAAEAPDFTFKKGTYAGQLCSAAAQSNPAEFALYMSAALKGSRIAEENQPAAQHWLNWAEAQ